MSSGTSTWAATTWLPLVFGIGTIPAFYYVGLVTRQPVASDDGSTVSAYEPGDAAYRRVTMGVGAVWWDAINGTIANHSAVTFPVPTADWGYITHAILCDQVGLGHLYCWGDLRTPQQVMQGIAPTFPPGSLLLSMPAG